ncbi:DUF2891 domain-containing protein [Maribacter sp. HTCC2170]|uniref:DUF2891 domain-containing protein n=1 Tax=Maribacter sp. (strain HTCC2170 / KCCM 42371) TaxID=313603 RepID=UPI00006AFD9F|nr:DUF2891 domain-containing protein [Maribacter sp. HTCC2170]EAR01517.1 hypothetical protein FB2170_12371 [Maribacter sp. HTCC2170]
MFKNLLQFLFLCLLALGCKEEQNPKGTNTELQEAPQLTLDEANRLASLPFGCIQVEYPNKLGQSLHDSTHIKPPKELHPAFYGCYDWHSSVHGHWSLVSLLKQFSSLDNNVLIRNMLMDNISKEHIETEIAYFKMTGNKSYERTYGWAWLLKLAEELHTWDDPMAKELETNLEPLTHLIIEGYMEFLPKLNYPIRVGEHSNTAFGLSLAWDYARTTGHIELQKVIETSVERFYMNDEGCPLSWEPSGFDFLSPCLEEANLVRKVVAPVVFKTWFNKFLPQLADANFVLDPGEVSDRTDGKLVHIDGLNFSRAWCLYGIAKALPEYKHLANIANEHVVYSLPSIVDGNYEGTHWLGSFAINALNNTK